jgi:hypothetical protein
MLTVKLLSRLDRWSELLESANISLVKPGSVFAFGKPAEIDRGVNPRESVSWRK